VILYILISNIFPNASYVGVFGKFLGDLNIKLFGYLSYFFDLFLFLLLFMFYFNKFDSRNSIKILGGLILFFDLLFVQALILNKGVIGRLFVDTLKAYIGIFGVVILIVVLGMWGVFLLFEDKIFEFFKQKSSLKKDIAESKEEISNEIEVIETKDDENHEIEDYKNEEINYEKTVEDIDVEEFPLLDEKDKENIETEIVKNEEERNKKENLEKDNSKENNLKNSFEEKKIEKVKHVEELEDTKKLLSQIEVGEREKPKDWKFPPLDILQKPPKKKREVNEAEIDKKIKVLLEKLKQFKIEGDVVRYYIGPVVTTFEFKPLPHIKVSKILSLQDDLAMALKAKSIRIQAPIPGKDVVGIEIPNDEMETIYLREILESEIFQKSKSPLTLALGKDIVGAPFVTDLKKLPHLLIAGTTGSGKSVGINSMILSLLYKNSPDELKFVMIDPKMLEFSIYNDIPHLLTPVITDSKKAITALNAMVKEMERRYKLMAKMRVKNIEGYNKKVSKEEKLPYIVIIIDELADLMMTSGKDVEYAIARLAQMARASGIHLIVATQRPSVDVVTGLIKANLPSRISFKVGQKIDSKVILDQFGAESLLGRGDMLFTPPGITGLIRLHAPFASEEEIEKVVEFLKSQREPVFDNSFISQIESEAEMEELDDVDELFEEAKEIILKERRTSISYLQRRLQIGYNRAANIIEQMERAGILSPPNAKGQREILI
jgi:S-DNA-T family DNA segregation ATPase FtsK/SpoIIIE